MNPLTIIAVSHDYTKNGFALFRSFNGGNTFTGSILPVTTSFDVLSDPIIDFGLNNISLISGIAVKNATNEASIIVFRSVDGGQNYANSIIVSTETGNGIFDDKEYLAIDKSPTSPFVGNAYISYTRFTGNFTNSQILLQRSVNGGLNWLPPVPITPVLPGLPFVQGSNVQVGPNGGVYVAWTEGDFNNALFKIRRSDDGGITFGPTITVSNIVEVPSPLNAKVPQWGFRVPTFAFLAVDTSGCFGSAEFARVYAAWQDFRSGNAHILLSFSDDGGANWSAPIRVDNSPEGSQNFFPFVTASPCSGTVNVIYYTNRESTTLLDVFGAKSLDGGLSFTSNSRITDVSFNPNADPSFGEPCQFIGDYIFAAISPPNASEPEKLISVWTDTLSGSQDIFANIDDQTRTPIISCPANITQNNAPGQCGAVVVFPPPSVNNICPGATVACTPASGSFFPVGTTTVTCMATDPCGGSAQCSFTVTVKDIEPPTIACPANITQVNDPSKCGAIVHYPAPVISDNCPGVTAVCSPASGSFFPVGTTTVTCTATDTAGNTAICSFTVTVKDIEPPTITCSANITQANDPGESGAIVHYPAPVVSDNCPGVTAVCSPASGSFFPVGTTMVTCTATDATGNTATCSFTVTVTNEAPPPLIPCPANIINCRLYPNICCQ
ncbi:HYR domain-containing protein [Bacillus sp. CGMCC 1.60114]